MMNFTVSEDELNRVIYAYHHDPFTVLGAHPVQLEGKPAVSVRAMLPGTEEAWVVPDGGLPVSMDRKDGTDFFEAQFPERDQVFPYEIRTLDQSGRESQARDPYSYLPVITPDDEYLFNQGNHWRTYEKLGAHVRTVDAVKGVHFAVWAPNAARVSVIGDFNRWDGRRHAMRVLGSSGIWEIFVPGLDEGHSYKYEVKTDAGAIMQKADPQGFLSELRPKTASIVWDVDKHRWGDAGWMAHRAGTNLLRGALAIYEVHLSSWMRVPETDGYLTYYDLAPRLAEHVKKEGYNYVELMPITEYPYDGSWGYQVTGYFAPTSRHGTPGDFQYFVDYLHQQGIGVIIDWVPAHFPKNDYGLAYFDGTALYEYADSRLGEHKAWGTNVFNFGRNEVRQFLINSALYWMDKHHVDGLRVDAVAAMIYRDYGRSEWLPNEYGGRENLEAIRFLQRLNEKVYAEHPGAVTIAEESTSFPMVSKPTYLGGLGFTFKWNMGWMHDTLDYISLDPIYRKYHHQNLTFGLMYAFSENFILAISHDEVVHLKRSLLDKMPGDLWQKFANLRLYFGFMWTHPGKKLLFMGQDLGQWHEWDEDQSMDWHLSEYEPHQKLMRWMSDLNRLYQSDAALWELDYEWMGFEWIDPNDWEHSVLSYIRRAADPTDYLVVVCNFTPVVREGYRLGVPEPCRYREVLNSDSDYYFGSNAGNGLGLPAQPFRWQQQPYSIEITLPPLACVILRPDRSGS
jgi:1,4-alpha-glucan branching enzyme